MEDRYLIALNIQHYRRLLKEGTLSEAAREMVHKLLVKAEAELDMLRTRPRLQ